MNTAVFKNLFSKSSAMLLSLCAVGMASAESDKDQNKSVVKPIQSNIQLVNHETTDSQPNQLVLADVVTEELANASNIIIDEEKKDETIIEMPEYKAVYDKGFKITPYDKKKNPYELKINGRMQFRYQGFHRDIMSFTNQGGTVPVENRNDFEIERGRLEFSGFFLDPNLHFYLNLDGDTDDNHRTIFHDFWVNYEFSERLNVFIGKAFVPGSREWLNGSTSTHLADRAMATTFFRPDRSVGVWATGKIGCNSYYRTMLGNGYNTTDLERGGFQIDDHLFLSNSMWWEPWGDFGKPGADIEWHDCAVLRMGSSSSYGQQRQMNNLPTREQIAAVRLSDGTILPLVGVLEYDLLSCALDMSWKYRGWSINSEFYARWINNIQSGGAFPHADLYQDGFMCDIGYMICPKQWEVVARVSMIDGIFNDAWEYAGGINWYLNGTHKNKMTFDVAVLDGNPASNSGPGYEVGMDGVFYRFQYQIAF